MGISVSSACRVRRADLGAFECLVITGIICHVGHNRHHMSCHDDAEKPEESGGAPVRA